MNDPDVKLLIFIVLAVGLIGAFMFFWDDIRPPPDTPVVMQHEPVVDEPAGSGEPVHPIEPLTSSEPSNKDLVPLPPDGAKLSIGSRQGPAPLPRRTRCAR